MDQRSTVLVVPAGTEIGLEIRESLALSKHWRLFAGNSLRDHSEATYYEGVFDLPFATDPRFPQLVADLAASVGADFVVPCHDDASFVLSRQDFGSSILVGPDAQLAAILRFKSKTYEALKGSGVACPAVLDPEAIGPDNLPVFAKPDRGQGSRGARKVATLAELDDARGVQGLLFTEYLEGPEFTVDCYTDRRGDLALASGRLRARINNGISVRAVEVDDPRFAEMARAISDALGIRGTWFFQVKADSAGALKLMEVANRVSGTMGFQRERGINLMEAWLHELKGRDVTFLPWKFGDVVLDRALAARAMWKFRPKTVYVDFDDTILLPGDKLNYRLVGLLFGLKANLGAEIVLLTRHRSDIAASVERLGLSGLFAAVRHLVNGEPKSAAITDPDGAILIDDSFAERAEVTRAVGIPAFPIEAMACLEGINHAALARYRP